MEGASKFGCRAAPVHDERDASREQNVHDLFSEAKGEMNARSLGKKRGNRNHL